MMPCRFFRLLFFVLFAVYAIAIIILRIAILRLLACWHFRRCFFAAAAITTMPHGRCHSAFLLFSRHFLRWCLILRQRCWCFISLYCCRHEPPLIISERHTFHFIFRCHFRRRRWCHWCLFDTPSWLRCRLRAMRGCLLMPPARASQRAVAARRGGCRCFRALRVRASASRAARARMRAAREAPPLSQKWGR